MVGKYIIEYPLFKDIERPTYAGIIGHIWSDSHSARESCADEPNGLRRGWTQSAVAGGSSASAATRRAAHCLKFGSSDWGSRSESVSRFVAGW